MVDSERSLELRVSDRERYAVSEALRQAAGAGRLDLDELDERLEAAHHARTYADLLPLTADLPEASPVVPPGRAAVPVTSGPVQQKSVSVLSDSARRGAWVVPPRYRAVAVAGSVVLDLREAVLPPGGVVIDAYASLGSVKILLDARTPVVVDGTGVLGDFKEKKPKVDPQVDPESPGVRVIGTTVLGDVVVRRMGPPAEDRRWLRRRS